MERTRITFRTPTAADLPLLNKISWQSKAFWDYPEEWLKRWKENLTITEDILHKQSVLLAEHDNTAIGFCVISEAPAQFEVEHLWVLPAHIGKGYGKRLLNEALSRFTSTNKPIHVEADPNAESFYARQGFVTFDQVESYPPGRFLPLMRKVATTS